MFQKHYKLPNFRMVVIIYVCEYIYIYIIHYCYIFYKNKKVLTVNASKTVALYWLGLGHVVIVNARHSSGSHCSVFFFFLYIPSDASPGVTLPTGVALPAGMALPTGAQDQDEPNRKNPPSKAKGKAKKPDGSQSTDNDLEVMQQLA